MDWAAGGYLPVSSLVLPGSGGCRCLRGLVAVAVNLPGVDLCWRAGGGSGGTGGECVVATPLNENPAVGLFFDDVCSRL